uniref:transposase n=1 Tax=Thiolapillus sp. TaxID=2017437 RepID=UPI003AF709FB
VDSVRRAENKALNKIGDNRLKGSRYCWLANEENIDKKRAEDIRPESCSCLGHTQSPDTDQEKGENEVLLRFDE